MMGTTETDELVASCKESAVQGMEMFLRNFAHVPEDQHDLPRAEADGHALHRHVGILARVNPVVGGRQGPTS